MFPPVGQAAFAGDLGLGPSLGFVWKVDVFQFRLGDCAGNLAFKIAGQLALAADGLDDRVTARIEFAQINEAFVERAQLRIVEPARDFLAIAGNERDGCSAIEKFYRRIGLFGPCVYLGGDETSDTGGVGSTGSHEAFP